MSILTDIIDAVRRFLGVRKSFDELAVDLDKKTAANPEKLDWRNSVVDLLKLTGQDSSLRARKDLAKTLGYTGTLNGDAAMNIWLHEKVLDRLR